MTAIRRRTAFLLIGPAEARLFSSCHHPSASPPCPAEQTDGADQRDTDQRDRRRLGNRSDVIQPQRNRPLNVLSLLRKAGMSMGGWQSWRDSRPWPR